MLIETQLFRFLRLEFPPFLNRFIPVFCRARTDIATVVSQEFITTPKHVSDLLKRPPFGAKMHRIVFLFYALSTYVRVYVEGKEGKGKRSKFQNRTALRIFCVLAPSFSFFRQTAYTTQNYSKSCFLLCRD